MKTVGGELRKFRAEFRYSQAKFAGIVGVSQALISAIEIGSLRPSDDLESRIKRTMTIIAMAEKAAHDAREYTLKSLL